MVERHVDARASVAAGPVVGEDSDLEPQQVQTTAKRVALITRRGRLHWANINEAPAAGECPCFNSHVVPGSGPAPPIPSGATFDGRGVNFALFSANAEKVELCLFDARGQRELERVAAARVHRPSLARLSAGRPAGAALWLPRLWPL